MGSPAIVVDPPGFDSLLRFRQRPEPLRVEAFVTESAVEAFDEAVLHGLPWWNEVELDASLVGPGVEVVGRELGAVVQANDGWRTPFCDGLVEDLGDSL